MGINKTRFKNKPQDDLPSLQRRGFVRAAVTGLASAPFFSLYGCGPACTTRNTSHLIRDRDGILDLAPGLRYTVLDRNGSTLRDGSTSPARPDGMGCFVANDGNWILMRNHEIDQKHIGSSDGTGAYELNNVPDSAYSTTDLGGVSRLVIDPTSLSVLESNMVLSGTRKNCAGGITPYGWLSCEESIDESGGNHGFVFLCDVSAGSLQPPQRIDAYGRFIHEAAGFDAQTSRCYLTEDTPSACLYRFLPDLIDSPFEGKLQALRVVGEDKFNTSQMKRSEMKSIDWIDVPNPLAGWNVSREAQSLGAAVFVRGEGCWFDDGRLVFATTAGGPQGSGQVFQLEDRDGGVTLKLPAQSDEQGDLSHPDNLTISPAGEIYLAEDHKCECLIQRLAMDGSLTAIARNYEEGEEIAGLCFSPDGRVLFGNIMEPGITFAISGF